MLDFDAGRTFLPVEGQTAEFIFSPFIRAVVASATGTVTGSVWGPIGGNDPAPIAGAEVLLWTSPCDSGVVCPVAAAILATTVTDSSGRFTFRYLTPGVYGTVADPPAGTALGEGGSLPFTVAMGDTTDVNITLPEVTPMLRIVGPTVVGPGQDVTLFAQVYGAVTDSGVPQVTWVSRDSTVARVTPSGLYATVHGVALGSTLIVATSGALADSLSMVVSTDSLPADTSQVAEVTVTPDSQTVAVGDSVFMTAHPTDSVGNALPSVPVTWAVGDSSLLSVVGVAQQRVVLKALGRGTFTVMATSGGKSGTATVRVE